MSVDSYARTKALVGKRVRVKRGTIKEFDRPAKGYHETAMWCAGHVPVGSTGTIVDFPTSPCLVQIIWDHGQRPYKSDYVFGLSRIAGELEEIEGEPETFVVSDGCEFVRQEDGTYSDGGAMEYASFEELLKEVTT